VAPEPRWRRKRRSARAGRPPWRSAPRRLAAAPGPAGNAAVRPPVEGGRRRRSPDRLPARGPRHPAGAGQTERDHLRVLWRRGRAPGARSPARPPGHPGLGRRCELPGGLSGHPSASSWPTTAATRPGPMAVVRQMVEQDKVVASSIPTPSARWSPSSPTWRTRASPFSARWSGDAGRLLGGRVPALHGRRQRGPPGASAVAGGADPTRRRSASCGREVAPAPWSRTGSGSCRATRASRSSTTPRSPSPNPTTRRGARAQQAGVEILMTFADIATVNRVAQSSHRQNYHPVLSPPTTCSTPRPSTMPTSSTGS